MLIRNLAPNPLPDPTNLKAFNWSGGANPGYWGASPVGVYIDGSKITGGNSGVLTTMPVTLPPGSYHWHSRYLSSDSSQATPVGIVDSIQIPSTAVTGDHIDYDFTLTSAVSKNIILRTIPGGSTTHSNIIICSAADWTEMQALGINYFDGGTMPLAS